MDKTIKGVTCLVSLALGIALLTLTVVGDRNINTVSIGNYFAGDIGETIVVTIDCTAYQDLPLKGWELKLSFNPDVVQVVSVEQGDFFGDHMTFFIEGVIDNVNGTIINMYSVDMNKTMVTDSGSLAVITFTVVGSGDCPLHLYDVGVCNDSAYVEKGVMDGSISFRHLWDLNEDGTCNILDVRLMALKYGHKTGRNPYAPEDLNQDGLVTINDFVLLACHWGESY